MVDFGFLNCRNGIPESDKNQQSTLINRQSSSPGSAEPQPGPSMGSQCKAKFHETAACRFGHSAGEENHGLSAQSRTSGGWRQGGLFPAVRICGQPVANPCSGPPAARLGKRCRRDGRRTLWQALCGGWPYDSAGWNPLGAAQIFFCKILQGF